jgi:DNA-binding transcriptional LysR family regulator
VQDTEKFVRQTDWNLFAQFFEIVRAGSLSAAGRKLNLRQPSLSAALKRLEDQLGVVLCHRSAKGVTLTAAGKALLTLCSDMVETVRMAPHLTSKAAGQVEGTLPIRLVSNVICREFDDSLASFHRRHPYVEIRLDVAPWRAVLESLVAGECQIGVTFDSGPRTGLHYEPLFHETQQLYCAESHPMYGQRIREPALLAEEWFVLTEMDEPEDLRKFRLRYGLGGNVAGYADDLQELHRLIRLGIGVGFMPTVVAEQPRMRGLWPLLAPALLPSYAIYLVAVPAPRMTTPAQLFLDEVRRRLRARQT